MMYGQIVPRGSTENTQNIQNASLTNEDPEAKRSRFSCPGCNFACNSLQNYKIHLHQTNHEDVEKVMTQNPSALNKPENQKMNTTKNTENQNVNTTRIPGNQMNTTRIPENQRMNTSEVPDNQKMNTARIPGIQMMNTTRVPGNQMMNTTNVPGNQMNPTRIPETQKMDTTRVPENQEMDTTRIPENQEMDTTRIPGNQMNPTKIPENQEMDTTSIPGNQVNPTRIPENQKMDTTSIPENQKIDTTRIPGNQMSTTSTPENQKMDTTSITGNQMNTKSIPENRKMDTTRLPGNQMSTTRFPENKKVVTTMVPGNQMSTTRFPENKKVVTTMVPGNQMSTTRIPEYKKVVTTTVPEIKGINTTRIPETKKMNITPNPDNQEIKSTKTPGTLAEHLRKSIFFLVDYLHKADREPLIGLQYVLEYKVRTKANRVVPKYICELCNFETDVVPMVVHLTGFRHRKLYLAKEYPYVLNANSKSSEDKPQFVRRMAQEIERDEGTKMFKIDNVVRMESNTSASQSKSITRRNIEGNQSQTRMNKALEYLESFEIDHDGEAVTVTGLTSKLTSDIKRFPVRDARAKDVAMSQMQNVSGERRTFQNPGPLGFVPPSFVPPSFVPPGFVPPGFVPPGFVPPGFVPPSFVPPGFVPPGFVPPNFVPPGFVPPGFVPPNPMLNMPPQFNRGPPEPNTMQDGFRGPNMHRIDQTKMMPDASVPQKPQQFPFVPSNQTQNIQNLSMPNTAGSAQSTAQSIQNNPSTEDLPFLKKLMTLLSVLPQNTSSTENVQMNSKLMMLKALLLGQKPSSDLSQQQMMMQIASLTQGTGNTDMGSLNQQLMTIMASQNPTTMKNVLLNQQMTQVASMGKNTLSMENPQLNQNLLMQMAGGMQDPQNRGNALMNLMSNLNQSVPNQQGGQVGSSSMMQRNQDADQKQNLNTRPEYAGASQNYGNVGYDRSVEGNNLSQADPVSQYDDMAESGIHKANEQTRAPYSEMSYESGIHGRKRNESSYRSPSAQVAGTSREREPYRRVSLSPDYMAPASNTRELYNSKQYDVPEWGDRESDILHSKRARLDMDRIPPRYSEDYYRESRQPYGRRTADLSEDIRDRIRGKDPFTVSAILSEYADKRSSK
ncbi:uncharacterized protein LOC134927837 isoform X9 [Pseudophryne corroboree]|uniref:uncharacterized protein LOC134927837 isoform X9 n=1 Tax=Pseudophryne corroboree TaxID=495146 RepID=UPI003081D645